MKKHSKLYIFLSMIACLFCSATGSAATLHVGPSHDLKKPSEAAKIVEDGDTVLFEPVTYTGDTAVFRANQLRLISADSQQMTLDANGQSAQGKAIWVLQGNNTHIEGITFANTRVPDKNGAGIRLEGNDLTVKNCRFINNENGILSGRFPKSSIRIENSEFGGNGHGDGQSHNLYIGHSKKLTIVGSYFHDAKVGHQIKSRAEENHIIYNRVSDNVKGTSSYLIDLPDGGLVIIMGNILQQGILTENSTLISYGTRQLNYSVNALYIVHNTFANYRHGTATYVNNRSSTNDVLIANNLFFGRGKILDGSGTEKNNVRTVRDIFKNSRDLDLRPTLGEQIEDKGIPISPTHAVETKPEQVYAHPNSTKPRERFGTAYDIGAYEVLN